MQLKLKSWLVTAGFCFFILPPADAGTYQMLHNFASVSQSRTNIHSDEINSDGENPVGGVVLSGTTLYGTTYGAGTNGYGTVFSIGTDGSGFALLHTFSLVDNSNINYDGAGPYGLVLSSNMLYGTTDSGGSNGLGAVFAMSTDGSNFTSLYSFTGSNDGGNPEAGLALSGDTLYGTTGFEGTNGAGTIFSVGINGGFHLLYAFNGTNDGDQPAGPLTVSGSTLYGTTIESGPPAGNGQGTIFSVGTDGMGYTVLHSFSALNESEANSDGSTPMGFLVITNGTLYGTASMGGENGNGTVFAIDLATTNFTVLHAFSAVNNTTFTNADGETPIGGLILSGMTLYGTAAGGGGTLSGTVFSIDTGTQKFTTLHSFGVYPDGDNPRDAVILSGSTLYGTTRLGGTNQTGVVFSLPASGSSTGGGGTGNGGVEVIIEPIGAVEAGAQWQVNGGGAEISGAKVTGLSGEQTVTFDSVPGWNAPAPKTVTVRGAAVSRITATYTFAGEGTYNGLFMQSNVTEASAGMLKSLVVTKTASYSGSLLVGGATHAIHGAFGGSSPQASNSIAHTDISVVLTLSLSPLEITGTVTTSSGAAGLVAYPSTNGPSGEFTALLGPDTNAAPNTQPAGDGYLVITNHDGAAKITGSLPTGTAFSQSTTVSASGEVPIYASLFGNKGVILGWLKLNGTPAGALAWIYPGVRNSLFTSAFSATNPVMLSPWTESTAQTVLPTLTNLTFASHNSVIQISGTTGKVTGAPITGTVNLKTGQLKVTADKITGNGAILLNTNLGGGYSITHTNQAALQLTP